MSDPQNEHPTDGESVVQASNDGTADEILTDGTLSEDADLSTDNKKK